MKTPRTPYLLSSLTLLVLQGVVASAQPEPAYPETADKPLIHLEEAIDVALLGNFAYRMASLNPDIARQSILQAESAFDVETFLSGQVSQDEQSTTFSQTTGTSSDQRRLQAGARKRLESGTSLTVQSNLGRRESNAGVNTSNLSQSSDFGISLRQPLLAGFGRKANIANTEIARAGFAGAVEALRDNLLQMLSRVELSYWNVARLQEQLELDESSLQVAETLLQEAIERERVGVATQIEVLQAQASQAQRLEEIIETRRALGDALDQLFNEMGIIPLDASYTQDIAHQVSPLPEEIEQLPEFLDIWSMAVRESPALAEQETVISQREWSRIQAENRTKPNLDLVVSGAYTGVDDRKAETAIENALNRDGHNWAIGVEFSMPWQMRGEKAAMRIAVRRLQQEEIRYQDLKQTLYRVTRSAWRNLNAVSQSMEAARLTVSLQEATFERELEKYAQGISVFRDVLEVQRDLDQARVRLLRAKYNRLLAEIEIDRLTGQLIQRHGLDPEALFLDYQPTATR